MSNIGEKLEEEYILDPDFNELDIKKNIKAFMSNKELLTEVLDESTYIKPFTSNEEHLLNTVAVENSCTACYKPHKSLNRSLNRENAAKTWEQSCARCQNRTYK